MTALDKIRLIGLLPRSPAPAGLLYLRLTAPKADRAGEELAVTAWAGSQRVR
jgi:hypothetical protein